jgi:tryptophan synthase alpha chain
MTAAGAGGATIEQSIRTAGAAGRPAMAAFLTAGFPDMTSFGKLVDAVAAEVEVLEIGVPFTDPMADGVTIQESSRRALEAGVTLPWILDVVAESTARTPIVLMSYLNPILAMGLEEFAHRAAKAGVAGLIVPDLPCEESAPVLQALDHAGLALIQLVAPVSPQDRIEKLCRMSRGFVYAVTTTGTTGGDVQRSDEMYDYLDRVRDVSPVPVLAGFGIRQPEHVDAVAAHAHGVIVGSALIEVLERGDDAIAFLRQLRRHPGAPLEEDS